METALVQFEYNKIEKFKKVLQLYDLTLHTLLDSTSAVLHQPVK